MSSSLTTLGRTATLRARKWHKKISYTVYLTDPIYETNAEKSEQERIKREYAETVRARIRSMINELCIALLEDDNEEIGRLRREYKNLRAYL